MDVAISSPDDDGRPLPAGDRVAPNDSALDRVETERTELDMEREALRRFADRVREIDPSRPKAVPAGVPSLSSGVSSE